MDFEKHILFSFGLTCEEPQDDLLLNDLLKGNFLSLIDSAADILTKIFPEHLNKDDNLEEIIKENIKKIINESNERHIFYLSIACFALFLQNNWTGPQTTLNISWLGDDKLTSKAISSLVIDGESCNPNVHYPELLCISKAFFQSLHETSKQINTSSWWLARCIFIQSYILDEPSQILLTEFSNLSKTIEEKINTYDINALKILYNLEAAQFYLYFGYIIKSKEHLALALEVASIEIDLKGLLGKRTKWQEKDIAQLCLDIQFKNERDDYTQKLTFTSKNLPRDLKLNDDVRLDNIKFTSEDEGKIPLLTPLEQALVLISFFQIKKSQPKDGLIVEELMPYLSCVLSTPKCWSLHLSSLLNRCILESSHRRTIERSMMQAENLVSCINSEEPNVTARLSLMFCSHLPPIWQSEAAFAQLLISLGSIQSALDMFIKLQLWEDVIVCYNILQLRHKAAEIIKQELDKNESVKLWCLLGDANDDISCYEKAWELSEHKSGRAQRHWANYYFNKHDYPKSIPHFQASLAINSLQANLWMRLGYAALDSEDWTLCANAYRRYCNLDSDSFEAWNNLAKAYIKLGQKSRAWRALQEALKCNYENWRVWDNLMVVSVDCAAYGEAIRAYHRILDLKEKHLDKEVLRILVHSILEDAEDNQGGRARRHLNDIQKLLGRLTSQIVNDMTLWQLYAEMTATIDPPTKESVYKTAQMYQKAYRSAVQTVNWFNDIETSKNIIELCISLANAYLRCTEVISTDQAKPLLSSAKLNLASIISKIKSTHTDLLTEKVAEPLAPSLQILEEKYNSILKYLGQ